MIYSQTILGVYCMTLLNQSMYVSMYIQSYFFLSFFNTQIILIVFFCGQINHLYDI